MSYSSLAQNRVIDRYGESITLLRESPAGVDIAGNLVPGAITSYNIRGVIQPLKSNEAYYLPEGIIAEDVRNLWIKNYQTINGAIISFTLNLGDRIQYPVSPPNDIYTVKSVQYWVAGNFYKARLYIVHDTR